MERLSTFTNEEKRINAYRTDIPTDPSSVMPETSLEELNLNWREKDLPERERTKHVHRLHTYLGKFIPQLVEIFLRKYFGPGDTIYDPFCGSGTTLVEANVLNINSIGCDIAPFNCLLSKVKTAEYDIALMQTEVLDILNKVRDRTQDTLFSQQWKEAGYDHLWFFTSRATSQFSPVPISLFPSSNSLCSIKLPESKNVTKTSTAC